MSLEHVSIDSETNNSPSEIELPLGRKKKATTLTAPEEVYFESLLNILKNGSDEEFLIEYSSTNSLKNYNDIQIKLFIQAIDKNSGIDLIEKILYNVTDINYIRGLGDTRKDDTTIIEDVCRAGNLAAFRKLLSLNHLKLPTTMEILLIFINSLNEDLFDKWFEILYAFDEFDVNGDNMNETPLWFANYVGKKKVMRKLLEAGAYIGSIIKQSKSKDKCPFDPKVIEEYFDSCIEGQLLTDMYLYPDHIAFNYKNLVPPKSQPDLNEMLPIMLFAKSKEHIHLLKHPLIISFMALKWQQISKFLYVHFFFYCFYLTSIVSYIVLTTRNKKESGFTKSIWWLTIFGTAYLIIREAIQFRSPKKYLQKTSNYLELLLIIFSILIITMKSVDKEIVVFGIILITLEFWIIAGSLSILSFSTHMLMLKEVLRTFLKSFSLYAIFVFMFALCFFVLFGPENNFENLLKSVVKTMAMVVGELNFEDLNLEGFCSYILIVLFIICMTVVLMNLLNGLAISDIQAIRQQAELNELIWRAKFLNNHDSKLFFKHHDGDKNSYCDFPRAHLSLFTNDIILRRCCKRNYGNKKHTKTEQRQRIWLRLLEAANNVWQTIDLWMENKKTAVDVETKQTIIRNIWNIRNKDSSTINEKNQLESFRQTVEKIENKVVNMYEKLLEIQQKSITIEQNVLNIDNRVQNIEQNLQNIEKRVQNTEQNVKNIGNLLKIKNKMLNKNLKILNKSNKALERMLKKN